MTNVIWAAKGTRMLVENQKNFFSTCFNGLNEIDRQYFSEKFTSKSLKKGQYIYKAGEQADEIYFLKKGAAKEVVYRKDGEELFSWYCVIGEPLGIYSVFGGGERWVNVQCTEDSEIIIIKANDFVELVKKSDTAILEILKAASELIKEEEQNKLDIMLCTTLERLAKFIVNEYERHYFKDFKLPKIKHVADYLNMTTQEISRKFKELEQGGYIERNNRHIQTVDIEKIKQEILGV